MIRITNFAWIWPDHPSGMCFAVYSNGVLLALCPLEETAKQIQQVHENLEMRISRNGADAMIREVDQARLSSSKDGKA